MVTDRMGRPSDVSWPAIIKIFDDAGFNNERRGGAGKGGLMVFSPRQGLREAQVSNTINFC